MSASTAATSQPSAGLPATGALDAQPLGCPHCHSPLEIQRTLARCAGCGTTFPVEDGVLCTHREQVFMGEFNARRMMDFVRLAREQGWRKTVRESMVPENRGAEAILMSPRRGSFIPLLRPRATGSVVDVGAGMGAVSMHLSESFERVYALDQAFERLAFLQVVADQEGKRQIRSICHRDVFSLPFQSGSIDAVTMIGVFEYFPASYPDLPIAEVQRRALAEVHRILAPGGVCFIATKNRYGWPYWLGAQDNSGVRFGPPLPRAIANLMSRAFLHRPFRIVTDSYRDYASMLRRSGFGDLEFHWPIVGYQAPNLWVNLDDRAAVQAAIASYPAGGAKRRFIASLARLGVLRHAVPNFGIVARKATA